MPARETVEEVVGELHALLKGDTGYKMAGVDVEFVDGGAKCTGFATILPFKHP